MIVYCLIADNKYDNIVEYINFKFKLLLFIISKKFVKLSIRIIFRPPKIMKINYENKS